MNLTTKSLLYLGCATFILTGSQVINRFIGANVSAASGREQLMSLMGYGKMAGIGATLVAGARSLGNTVRKVMPRASYNTSYYRRRKNMI